MIFKKYRLKDGDIYWHKLYYAMMPSLFTDYGPPFGSYNWAWYFYNPHTYLFHLWEEAKWFIQRGRRGYSDRDVWGWCDYMARINNTALRRLAEDKKGHPMGMTAEGWHKRILTMIDGFQAFIDNEDDWVSYKRLSKKKYLALIEGRQKRIKVGLRLWGRHFCNLWD